MSTNSSYKQVVDGEGRVIWNVSEYNGRVYGTYRGDLVERIESFKKKPFPVREDDIYLLTYPKCGTRWGLEILTAVTGISKRPPMLELNYDSLEPFPHGETQRILTTHLRYDEMPPAMLTNTSAKIIQVLRNPADTAVSFYYHLKEEVKGIALSYEWDDYITKLFCDKQRMVNGTWFDYTCEWWTHCNKNPNYMTVFFEELKEDPVKAITEIAEFLEVKADKDLIQSIVDQTSFQKMKEVNDPKEAELFKFVFTEGYSMYRKGVVGDWRNHFTKEQHHQFMEYYNQQLQDFPELHQRYIKYLQW